MAKKRPPCQCGGTTVKRQRKCPGCDIATWVPENCVACEDVIMEYPRCAGCGRVVA